MRGSITRYRKKDGRVSWGYYYKSNGEQFTKSGFTTKDAAAEALRSAIAANGGAPISAPIRMDGGSLSLPDADTRVLNEYLRYWLDEHAAHRCAPTTMEL